MIKETQAPARGKKLRVCFHFWWHQGSRRRVVGVLGYGLVVVWWGPGLDDLWLGLRLLVGSDSSPRAWLPRFVRVGSTEKTKTRNRICRAAEGSRSRLLFLMRCCDVATHPSLSFPGGGAARPAWELSRCRTLPTSSYCRSAWALLTAHLVAIDVALDLALAPLAVAGCHVADDLRVVRSQSPDPVGHAQRYGESGGPPGAGPRCARW